MPKMQIGDAPYPVCDAGFSGSEFGVQGMKLPYRERGCDELEAWAKTTLTSTSPLSIRHVSSSWLFEWRWDCPSSSCLFFRSPSLCSHFRIMLATTSSPCLTNVSLLLQHGAVSMAYRNTASTRCRSWDWRCCGWEMWSQSAFVWMPHRRWLQVQHGRFVLSAYDCFDKI